MFPFSVAGSVRFRRGTSSRSGTIAAVTGRIVGMLEDASADDVRVDGGTVIFDVGWWRPTWSWNILAPFNGGTLSVEVETNRVRVFYRFRTTRVLAIATVLAATLTGFIALHNQYHFAATMFCLSFLWLFGSNFLIAKIRVPIWLWRHLRVLPELQRPQSGTAFCRSASCPFWQILPEGDRVPRLMPPSARHPGHR